MDRAERVGLGAAVAGHVMLFGLLSLGFLQPPEIHKATPQPIEVTLADEVALESASPEPAEAAAAVAPEVGAPEDAAPPEPAEAAAPEPDPAPPPPEPKPQPAPPKPAPPKPAPPKPAPKPVPKPKPAPPRPEPKPAPARPAPAKPAPAKPAAAKPAPAKPATVAAKPAPAKPAATRGAGSTATAKATRPRGSLLGDDFRAGLGKAEAPAKPNAAPAQRIGAQQLANIGSAITRQVQPCADRQVSPGPGAERIRVTIRLQINRDGSLAARPVVRGHDGVDASNERYVDRVDDLAVATFIGCSPLRGLPVELYDVPGGWKVFSLRYKLLG